MDAKRLEEWIERYFNAELSIDEERQLVHLLATTQAPAHLERDKRLILSLHADATREHTTAIQHLSEQIDEWAAQEHRPIRHPFTTRLWRVASIAACALLVIGISLQLYRPSTPRDTFDTPKEAYAATYEAMLIFSSALNKGSNYANMAMATGKKVERSVSHQLETFKNFENNN